MDTGKGSLAFWFPGLKAPWEAWRREPGLCWRFLPVSRSQETGRGWDSAVFWGSTELCERLFGDHWAACVGD